MSRFHYSSVDAATNSRVPDDIRYPISELYLGSALFRRNTALERVLQYNIPQGVAAGVPLSAPHIIPLRKATAIILIANGMASKAAELSLTDQEYETDLAAKVELVQGAILDSGEKIDGVIGRVTLLAMDEELQRIRNYAYGKNEARVIHNSKTWFDINQASQVYKAPNLLPAAQAIPFYKEPSTQSPVIGHVGLNTWVYIHESSSNLSVPGGWLFVQLFDNETDALGGPQIKSQTAGYIQEDYVWTRTWPTERGATLRKVETGEAGSLQSIVTGHYSLPKDPNVADSEEWYNYALQIFHYNNPEGGDTLESGIPASVYLKFAVADDPAGFWENAWTVAATTAAAAVFPVTGWIAALATQYALQSSESGGIWDNVKLRESTSSVEHYIWLPGDAYVQKQKSVFDEKYNLLPQDNSVGVLWSAACTTASETMAALANGEYDSIKTLLDAVMPVGWGIHMDGKLGITFGAPSGEVNSELEITRPSEYIIKIKKKGELQIGAKVQAGEKGKITLGKRRLGKNLGARLSLAAEASAKAYIKVEQEFEFPLNESHGVVSMLATLLNMESGVGYLALMFANAFYDWDIDPMDYQTNTEVSLGIKGEAGAIVSAGLEVPTADDWANPNDELARTIESDGRFSVWSLLSLCKIEAGIKAKIDLGGSVTYKVEEPADKGLKFFEDPRTGERIARKVSFKFQIKRELIGEISGTAAGWKNALETTNTGTFAVTFILETERLFDDTGLIQYQEGVGGLISDGILVVKVEPAIKVGTKHAFSGAESSFELTMDALGWLAPLAEDPPDTAELFSVQHQLASIAEIKLTRKMLLSGIFGELKPKITLGSGGDPPDNVTFSQFFKAISELDKLLEKAKVTKVGGELKFDNTIEFEGKVDLDQIRPVAEQLYYQAKELVSSSASSILDNTKMFFRLMYKPTGYAKVDATGVALQLADSVNHLVQEIIKWTICEKLLLKRQFIVAGDVELMVGAAANVELVLGVGVGLIFELDVTEQMKHHFRIEGDTQTLDTDALTLANFLLAYDQKKFRDLSKSY